MNRTTAGGADVISGTQPEGSVIIDCPDPVAEVAAALTAPGYIYDLSALVAHAAQVRSAMPGIEVFYPVKANPDHRILESLLGTVSGFEVASGGELVHVRTRFSDAAVLFGGPGKTDTELALAGDLGVERIHVESPYELRRLAATQLPWDVVLRVNVPVDVSGAALAMKGPFGMEGEAWDTCAKVVAEAPWLRLRGLHAHLASGLAAPELAGVAAQVLGAVRPWADQHGITEFNLGGGAQVSYVESSARFDWPRYGAALATLHRPGETFRIEPGRSLVAYCGWYATQVLDVKRNGGQWFAVLAGGTHHLRTPAAKGHDQPFAVLPGSRPASQRSGLPSVRDERVTLVGQLCTPKDVLARRAPVDRLTVGDTVVFGLAGAYAWNISHHDFLMHPKPSFHYLDPA